MREGLEERWREKGEGSGGERWEREESTLKIFDNQQIHKKSPSSVGDLTMF